MNKNLSNIKTYVGTDGKIHFVNSAGADSALNFSKTPKITQIATSTTGKATGSCSKGDIIVIHWTSYLDVATATYSGITITHSFTHEGGHESDAGTGGACIGVATGTSVSISHEIYGTNSMNRCYIWKVTT